MEIVFPPTPYPGQTFLQWVWDGEKWVAAPTSGLAPLFSPQFSGDPTTPTPPPGSNDGSIASTAFVMNAIVASTAGVVSFNNRSGIVDLELQDIIDAGGAPIANPQFTGAPMAPKPPGNSTTNQIATCSWVNDRLTEGLLTGTVVSFNGRQGQVQLMLADITGANGAPILNPIFIGTPQAPTPPATDSSTRIATTAYVSGNIAVVQSQLDNLAGNSVHSFNTRVGDVVLNLNDVLATGIVDYVAQNTVRSFNGRHGDVVLQLNDILAADGAPIVSPQLRGIPTAPTPLPATNNTQIATTAFVQSLIRTVPVGPQGPPGPPGPPGTAFHVKGSVMDFAKLPLTGNQNGDIWITEDDGKAWVWNGNSWQQVALGDIAAFVTVSPLPPPFPIPSQLWWDSDNGELMIWYVGPSGVGTWVVANSVGPQGPPGPVGPQGPPGPAGMSLVEPPTPAVGASGDFWVNSLTSQLNYSDGTAWQSMVSRLLPLQAEAAPDTTGILWWDNSQPWLKVWRQTHGRWQSIGTRIGGTGNANGGTFSLWNPATDVWTAFAPGARYALSAPAAATFGIGSLYTNQNNGLLYVNDGAGTWVSVTACVVGAQPTSGLRPGFFWLDTATNELRLYDGTTWRLAASGVV